jgi:hypothetical protein
MANPQPFSPGASATLAITTSSANVQLPSGSGTRFLLQNSGTAPIFFATGGSTVTATASSTPLLGGEAKVFTLDPSATYIAGIVGTGTATLYITRGEGN